jgi:hypothetical protein
MSKRRIRTATSLDKIRKQYKKYNRIVFNYSLPERIKLKIYKKKDALAETSRFEDENGATLHFQMEFSKDLLRLGNRLTYIVLLHEMCHLAAGLHNGHNKLYMANIRRLTKHGFFDDLLG